MTHTDGTFIAGPHTRPGRPEMRRRLFTARRAKPVTKPHPEHGTEPSYYATRALNPTKPNLDRDRRRAHRKAARRTRKANRP